jgi:hypothetical protein
MREIKESITWGVTVVVDAAVVAQVMFAHSAGARHGHNARCALKLGRLPQIVGIIMKKTMSRNSGLPQIGHTATNCWHRYEEDYVQEQRTTVVASSTGTDPA